MNNLITFNLNFIFDTWVYDESMDQYHTETPSHGFIVYLPEENTFIVNEGTEKEYEADINKVTNILGLACEEVNTTQPEQTNTLSDLQILKARETFNAENKKSAFRLDKKFSYISGLMSEREKVEELVKQPNSKLELEDDRYFVWVDDKGTGLSKIAAKYFEYLKAM